MGQSRDGSCVLPCKHDRSGPRPTDRRGPRSGGAEEHIYVDKRTGANTDREGLRALLGFARPGDRINVLTLDRLGRNMRETLNLVHDLTERDVFLRTLGDKLAVDTSEPGPGTDIANRAAGDRADGADLHARECRRRPRQLRPAACRQAAPRSSTPPPEPQLPNGSRTAQSPNIAAALGVSRSPLYRELRKHREGATAGPVGQKG